MLSKMRILLVQPPVEDFFFTPARTYPLGLLSLATVLDAAGFDVKIFNFLERPLKRTIQFPREFIYLKRYYRTNDSPFKLFSVYRRFGADISEIDALIKSFRPHAVGISANFSAYLDQALEIALQIRRNDSRITTIVGGRAASASPELLLVHREIDFVLRGEAEFSLLGLCHGLKRGTLKKVPGLCYRTKQGTFSITKEKALILDINELPVLKRSLIDNAAYTWRGMVSASLLTSRGCGLRCSFCAIREPFRYLKAQRAMAEIEACFRLGIRHCNFEDDNINLNPEFEKIIDAMLERFSGKVKISFMNGLLSAGLRPSLRRKLVQLGLTHLDLSIASTVSGLRKKMKRTENVARIVRIGKCLSASKIPVTAHFIIGFPHQHFRDAVCDLRLLASQEVLLGPSIYYPVIESSMFGAIKTKHGLSEKDYLLFRSSAAVFDREITRDRIFTLFYLCRIINFIKELTEDFEKAHIDLNIFIQEKTRGFSAFTDELICDAPLGRITLGALILRRLFAECRIFCAKRHREKRRYRYEFIPEQFAKRADIAAVLSRLAVCGIAGNTTTLPFLKPLSSHPQETPGLPPMFHNSCWNYY